MGKVSASFSSMTSGVLSLKGWGDMLFSFFNNKSLRLAHIRRFMLGCPLIFDGGQCLVRCVSTKKKKNSA